MDVAFILALGILGYAWILYSGIMMVIGRLKGAFPVTPCRDENLPPVVVVLSAHNREKVIGARISNLLALDYPHDRLRIHVGVDGCNDRTESIARAWAETDPRIHVTSREQCAGKTAMLKAIIRALTVEQVPATPLSVNGYSLLVKATNNQEPITNTFPASRPAYVQPSHIPGLLVFTDANTMFKPDALRRLAAPFADPKIGGVCGRLLLGCASGSVNGCSLPVIGNTNNNEPITDNGAEGAADKPTYWNLETLIKAGESRVDSCLGANGAIYAIRAELFPAGIPDNT
ncbi:MAG: glycosyltransferase, partial [bacterium]